MLRPRRLARSPRARSWGSGEYWVPELTLATVPSVSRSLISQIETFDHVPADTKYASLPHRYSSIDRRVVNCHPRYASSASTISRTT